jgi:hypothetical protein
MVGKRFDEVHGVARVQPADEGRGVCGAVEDRSQELGVERPEMAAHDGVGLAMLRDIVGIH